MQRESLFEGRQASGVSRITVGLEAVGAGATSEAHQKLAEILRKVEATGALAAAEFEMVSDAVRVAQDDNRFVRYRYIKTQSGKEATLWRLACEHLRLREDALAEEVIPRIQHILKTDGTQFERSISNTINRLVTASLGQKLAEIGQSPQIFVMSDDISEAKERFLLSLQSVVQQEFSAQFKTNVDEVYKHVDSRKSQGFTRVGEVQLPKYQQFLNLQMESEARIAALLEKLKAELLVVNKKKVSDFMLGEEGTETQEGGERASLEGSADRHLRGSNPLFSRKSRSMGAEDAPAAPTERVSALDFESELRNGMQNVRTLDDWLEHIKRHTTSGEPREELPAKITSRMLELADLYEQGLTSKFIHTARQDPPAPIVGTEPNGFFKEQFLRYFRETSKQMRAACARIESLTAENAKLTQNFTLFWDSVASALGVSPKDDLVGHLNHRLAADQVSVQNLSQQMNYMVTSLSKMLGLTEGVVSLEYLIAQTNNMAAANQDLSSKLGALQEGVTRILGQPLTSQPTIESVVTQLNSLKEEKEEAQKAAVESAKNEENVKKITRNCSNFVQELCISLDMEVPDLDADSLQTWDFKKVLQTVENRCRGEETTKKELETLKQSTVKALSDPSQGQNGANLPSERDLPQKIFQVSQERALWKSEFEGLLHDLNAIFELNLSPEKLRTDPAKSARQVSTVLADFRQKSQMKDKEVASFLDFVAQTLNKPSARNSIPQLTSRLTETTNHLASLSKELTDFINQATAVLEYPPSQFINLTNVLSDLTQLKAKEALLGSMASTLKVKDMVTRNDFDSLGKELKKLNTDSAALQRIQESIGVLPTNNLEAFNQEVKKIKVKLHFADWLASKMAPEFKTLQGFSSTTEVESVGEKIKESLGFSRLLLVDLLSLNGEKEDEARLELAQLRDEFVKDAVQNWPNEATGQTKANYDRFFGLLGQIFGLKKIKTALKTDFPHLLKGEDSEMREDSPEVILREFKRASALNTRLSLAIQKGIGSELDQTADFTSETYIKQFKSRVKKLAFLEKELKNNFPDIELADQISLAFFLKNLKKSEEVFKLLAATFPEWFMATPSFSGNEQGFIKEIKMAISEAANFEKLATKLFKKVFEKSPEYVAESFTALEGCIDELESYRAIFGGSFDVDRSKMKEFGKNAQVAFRAFNSVKKVFPEHLTEQNGALQCDISGLESALRSKNNFLESLVQGLSGVIPDLESFGFDRPDRVVAVLREAIMVSNDLTRRFFASAQLAAGVTAEKAAELFDHLESATAQTKEASITCNETSVENVSAQKMDGFLDCVQNILVELLEVISTAYPTNLRFSTKDSGKVQAMVSLLKQFVSLGFQAMTVAANLRSTQAEPSTFFHATATFIKKIEVISPVFDRLAAEFPNFVDVSQAVPVIDSEGLWNRIGHLKSVTSRFENEFLGKNLGAQQTITVAQTKLSELQTAQEFRDFFTQKTKSVYNALESKKRKEETLFELLADHDFVQQIGVRFTPDAHKKEPISDPLKAEIMGAIDFYFLLKTELESVNLPITGIPAEHVSQRLQSILKSSNYFNALTTKLAAITGPISDDAVVNKCIESVQFSANESEFVQKISAMNQKGVADKIFKEKVLESLASHFKYKKRLQKIKADLKLDLWTPNDAEFDASLAQTSTLAHLATELAAAIPQTLPDPADTTAHAAAINQVKLAFEMRKIIESEFALFGYDVAKPIDNLRDYLAQSDLYRDLFYRLCPDDDIVGTLEENQKRVVEVIEDFNSLDKLRTFAVTSCGIVDNYDWSDAFIKKVADTMDHLEFKKKSASLIESKYEEINTKYSKAIEDANKPAPAAPAPAKGGVRGKAPARPTPPVGRGKQGAKPVEAPPEDPSAKLKQKIVELEKLVDRMKIGYEILGIDYTQPGLDEALRLKIVELKSVKDAMAPSLRVSMLNETESSRFGVNRGSRDTVRPGDSFRFSTRQLFARPTLIKGISRGSVDTQRRMYDSVGTPRADDAELAPKPDLLSPTLPLAARPPNP